MVKLKRCPRCNEVYSYSPAKSQRDNKTDICPSCYVAESYEDYLGEAYSGNKYWDESLTEAAANSNGVYSLKNGWLKVPVKDDIPDTIDLEPELSEWLRRYDTCRTIDDIDQFMDDVYKLRQSSLVADGEYGKGNQIFKELRNRGVLQDLKDYKVQLENEEMSLTEEARTQQAMQDRRARCVEYYHHCMESYNVPGAYDRNNPTIDDYVLTRTSRKFGYSGNDIINFLKGEN